MSDDEVKEYRYGDLVIRPGSVPDTPPGTMPKFPKYNNPSSYYPDVCKGCYIKVQNTIFTPCGHISRCYECAITIPNCPICQNAISCTYVIQYS